MTRFAQILIFPCLFLLPIISIAKQNCNVNGKSPPLDSKRFTINNDGTVVDTSTGLMWKKCSEGQTDDDCNDEAVSYLSKDALKIPQQVNNSGGFAGYTDWRLPSYSELSSIVEKQCVEPAINSNAFPNTPSSGFWTSTTGNDNKLEYVWFYTYLEGHYLDMRLPFYVRLIRLPMPHI